MSIDRLRHPRTPASRAALLTGSSFLVSTTAVLAACSSSTPKPTTTRSTQRSTAPSSPASSPPSQDTQSPTPSPSAVPGLAPFRDDFNEPQLDTRYWEAGDYPGTNYNGYRTPRNVKVENGMLVLEGIGDKISNVHLRVPQGSGYSYGDYSARIRADVGGGYVPAYFLWPNSERWPEDGEIDAIEMTGENRKDSAINLHYPNEDEHGSHGHTAVDFSQWVVVKIEWRRDRVSVFFNGQKAFEDTNPSHLIAAAKYPVFQLDLSPKDADGHYVHEWGDPPGPNTPQPFRFDIDWAEFDPIVGVSVPEGAAQPVRTLKPSYGPGLGG